MIILKEPPGITGWMALWVKQKEAVKILTEEMVTTMAKNFSAQRATEEELDKLLEGPFR